MPSCFHYCFTGGGGKKSLKLLPLYRCDLPVLSLRDSLQSQVHDPETFEFLYLVAQILTHPSDLAVQALGEYDPEEILFVVQGELEYTESLDDDEE